MTNVVSVGTYLPPWTAGGRRVKGPDEDALTMAVAAGRAADPDASAQRVVMVTRNFPLLEGGNGAVLLAGLSLPADVPVTEVLGGAPAVLDQITGAAPGTLVIAADDNDATAGSAAVLTGTEGGVGVHAASRQTRSLPIVARGDDGVRHVYGDPRLQREVGAKSTLARLDLPGTPKVAAVTGVPVAQLGSGLQTSDALVDPTVSAAGIIRLLADAIEANRTGLLLAVEQSTVSAAELVDGTAPKIARDEAPARELPKTRVADGVGIPISLAAYARAFEPKIRWEAAVFEERPGIDTAPQFPPRVRVDNNGVLADEYRLVPLPRFGTVYTHTTIRIPVPDLPSPYSLAVVQLDESPVRVLLKVTGVPAGEATVGQAGAVVLRKVATRTGVPDYGYAFWPGRTELGAHA
ncbi:hypothetical protein BH09ACT8_BH09ACT8_34760 [soil metagenome]